MSWNGTVRCGICYKQGHNKSGCPVVMERYKEYQKLIADYKKKNPGVDPEADFDWDMRQKVGIKYTHLQAKSIIETKKRKNTTRQCTYCGTVGHNRRTCAPLKDHIGQLVEASALYNTKVAKAFELSGIYVGALIQYKVEEYDYNKCEWIKENRMGIVSRVDLKSYNVMSYLFSSYQTHNAITVRSTAGKEHHLRPELPANVREDLLIGYSWGGKSTYTLLSSKDTPVSPHEFVEKEERKFIKEYLKDVDQRQVDYRLEDKLKALSGDS